MVRTGIITRNNIVANKGTTETNRHYQSSEGLYSVGCRVQSFAGLQIGFDQDQGHRPRVADLVI